MKSDSLTHNFQMLLQIIRPFRSSPEWPPPALISPTLTNSSATLRPTFPSLTASSFFLAKILSILHLAALRSSPSCSSTQQLAGEVQIHQIHWLIVKRELEINDDPTPEHEATLKALLPAFTLVTHLRAYDIYRR